MRPRMNILRTRMRPCQFHGGTREGTAVPAVCPPAPRRDALRCIRFALCALRFAALPYGEPGRMAMRTRHRKQMGVEAMRWACAANHLTVFAANRYAAMDRAAGLLPVLNAKTQRGKGAERVGGGTDGRSRGGTRHGMAHRLCALRFEDASRRGGWVVGIGLLRD